MLRCADGDLFNWSPFKTDDYEISVKGSYVVYNRLRDKMHQTF